MVEHGRGEWPTWLFGLGCGGAFVCGLFVSWAVFAEPARAEPHEPQPAAKVEPSHDQAALVARIEALEKRLGKGMVEFDILKTRMMSVTDAEGRDRIVMGTVFDEASISIQRPNGETALVMKESKGAVSIVLLDPSKSPRLILASANDHAEVDLFDSEKRMRARLVVVPNGDGMVGVLDQREKPRASLMAGETFNGVMLFDEKGKGTTFK